jgi:putative molybdopterin biosynthesis protein
VSWDAGPSDSDGPVIRLALDWGRGESKVDLIELACLLASLDDSPRMASAARGGAVSYRTAWGRIVAAERSLGLALVERVKGHGTSLTPAGRELAEEVARLEQQAHKRLAQPLAALHERLARIGRPAPRVPLRIAASHDLLLQRCLAERKVEGFSVRFVGSEDALRALERGEADLAGFHRPLGERPAPASLARGKPAFVMPLVRREQGLIVAAGNPMRVRDVTDLARSGLRFVNRQRGAATRTWLDRLLREAGIPPEQIAGYEVEEPSHLAVAATVAARAADAGFGLRAAAHRFQLGFVPIGTETYWLAGAPELREDLRVKVLVSAVRLLAGKTPGYERVLR